MDLVKSKFIIIIPAYEPPEDFAYYAEKAARRADLLLVVNDGSGKDFDSVFEKIGQMPNTQVIGYGKNRGKGFALKYAFSYCEKNCRDEDVIVTADCDGQHSVKDICSLYEQSLQHPDTVIIGSRDFSRECVPQRSRAGNACMRILMRLLYGVRVYDTQSGLRAFSVELAKQLCRVGGDRFEYETGVLIHAKRHGIPMYEHSIETIYPKDPGKHVSHFRSFADSLRVVGTVAKHMGGYMLSSCAAALTDVLIFTVFSTVIFKEESPLYSLIATVAARVISSAVNFTLNSRLVFKESSGSSMPRYYALWAAQLICSYGIVVLFGNTLGLNLVAVKAVGDLCLAVLSYHIQRVWVFAKKDPARSFFGPLAVTARFFARLFSPKYRLLTADTDMPCVFVCRHLDMHGPYTTLKWLDLDVHPMVLSVFTDRRECRRQYSEYTFTERNGKKPGAWTALKSTVASFFVAKTVRSLRPVPVYRDSVKVIKTLFFGVNFLLRGESLIVYPDIGYTEKYDSYQEIYRGFLYMGEMYRKRSGRSLGFVPLVIDDSRRTITALPAVTADSYSRDSMSAADYLTKAINRIPISHDTSDVSQS